MIHSPQLCTPIEGRVKGGQGRYQRAICVPSAVHRCRASEHELLAVKIMIAHSENLKGWRPHQLSRNYHLARR